MLEGVPDLVVGACGLGEGLEPALLLELVPVLRQVVDEVGDLVHNGPAVISTITTTAANSTANATTEARPRFQPRRTSAPTGGSRPRASTAATKIESSVPIERMASATRPAKASTTTIVRTGMRISTRSGGGRLLVSVAKSAGAPFPSGVFSAGVAVMASGGPSRRRERVLQALLGLVVQRGLDEIVPETLICGQDLVGRRRGGRGG